MEKLLLHICCANCGIVPIESLTPRFNVTLFWYNPNIHPKRESEKRLTEVKKLAAIYQVDLLAGKDDPERWFELVKGLEKEPEGGKRCEICFQMRLEKTAIVAKEKGFDYFAATLTSGSQKRAATVNFWGEKLAQEKGLKFFNADFKKQGGFQKSVELSKKYNFYRQNYCGCAFSVRIFNPQNRI